MNYEDIFLLQHIYYITLNAVHFKKVIYTKILFFLIAMNIKL